MDPQIERKLIEIMRVINETDKPIGARAIADELNDRGYDIGERAVRYHLRILDERGFTRKHGYAGRTLTELGESEMSDALIGDRFGFVISQIEEMAFRTTINPKTSEGVVPVNISYFAKEDLETVIDVISYTAHSGYMISPKVRIFEEDEDLIFLPPGKVGIATVCSVTFDGLLLKSGIPVEPSYGGILQIENRKPSYFLDLISYSGTSIDPIQIFMKRKPTSVLEVVETGEGKILANIRQINLSAYDRVIEIIQQAEKMGLGGGCFPPGEIDGSLLGAPIEMGKFGIAIVGGINGICALEETGIRIETNPVSTVMEYKTMSEI